MQKELKVGQRYGIKDSFPMYKETCREAGIKPKSLATYLSIAYQFMKFLMKKTLEGHTVVLPVRMGKTLIQGRKIEFKIGEDGLPVKQAPDWKETKELWDRCPECRERKQMVYFLNEHTGGIRYKIYWGKEEIAAKNISLYSLQFTRHNKRTISSIIKNSEMEYKVLLPKERRVKIKDNNEQD